MRRRIPILMTTLAALGALVFLDYGGAAWVARRLDGPASAPAPPPASVSSAAPASPPAGASETSSAAAALGGVRREASTAGARRDQRWGLINAHARIESAYRASAVPYAEAVTGLASFSLEHHPPREILEAALRGLIPVQVEVHDLVLAEAVERGPGVYLLTARVRLSSRDPAAMLDVLWTLGEPAYGLVWHSFNLDADAEAREVRLQGVLEAMVVHAVE